jgi:hypothetical protein
MHDNNNYFVLKNARPAQIRRNVSCGFWEKQVEKANASAVAFLEIFAYHIVFIIYTWRCAQHVLWNMLAAVMNIPSDQRTGERANTQANNSTMRGDLLCSLIQAVFESSTHCLQLISVLMGLIKT